jgi:hypothetical protein
VKKQDAEMNLASTNNKKQRRIYCFKTNKKCSSKRDGHKEPMFDKITDRIKKLCYGLNDLVDAVKVAMRVIEGLYDGVSTSELDNLAAETAASMTASRLCTISSENCDFKSAFQYKIIFGNNDRCLNM